ncbi:murein L,D-transpeptidase catalytic domain-containing protein [uncultured Dysgonomonas sp.]|uniref:Peptidase n=1 Tax=uncultured Dysgonomonas sp. TaxID=206096 RepID=A0A212J212_9BACT|nr:murein L,D-transpeptidase catalytic domain family protein [uncultured Dysgonomonas sp.]SBV93506.1 conserved hypothetical protein [uncultured Dysgonomonas sp.]
MKTFGSIILAILLLVGLVSFIRYKSCNSRVDRTEHRNTEDENLVAFTRLKSKADSALAYCKSKGFSTEYSILIDFSIHSGKKRFFVWDFAKDTIRYSGLCCHGYGMESTQSKPVFSNVEGSYCSSLGKYKIGARAYSSWGINVHYKMHGLEKTNSNAFKRWVVLHSHTPVVDHDIHPKHLPLGWSQGCPVVSNEMMRKVDEMLKASRKPVLMWIYN